MPIEEDLDPDFDRAEDESEDEADDLIIGSPSRVPGTLQLPPSELRLRRQNAIRPERADTPTRPTGLSNAEIQTQTRNALLAAFGFDDASSDFPPVSLNLR